MKKVFTIRSVDGLQIFYSHEGMICGSVKGEVAFFGEEVNMSMQRGFDSNNNALAWVQKKCREQYGATEFEEASSRIVLCDPSALSRARH